MTTTVTITAAKTCQPHVAVGVTVHSYGKDQPTIALVDGESTSVNVFDGQTFTVAEIPRPAAAE